MRTMMLWSLLFSVWFLGGCKEAVITYPVPYDETDFTVPSAQFTGSTISLSVNRLNKIVYVGEEFEIKVALYNMPESLFAASLDISVPANIRIERIVRNPDYIGSATNTIGLEVCTTQNASFGVSYKRTTTPHVLSSGVLLKIICKAVTIGDQIQLSAANTNFRVTRRNVPLMPTSVNVNLSVAPVGVGVTVSDEFSR